MFLNHVLHARLYGRFRNRYLVLYYSTSFRILPKVWYSSCLGGTVCSVVWELYKSSMSDIEGKISKTFGKY